MRLEITEKGKKLTFKAITGMASFEFTKEYKKAIHVAVDMKKIKDAVTIRENDVIYFYVEGEKEAIMKSNKGCTNADIEEFIEALDTPIDVVQSKVYFGDMIKEVKFRNHFWQLWLARDPEKTNTPAAPVAQPEPAKA